MINSIEIAKSCGFISDDNIFITSDDANRMNPSEVCILCTGSQGEPLAALSRIANGVDSNVKLLPDDTIIFSSSPIPGNALSINRVINKLYLKGAKVYTNASESDIHTSGHGKQDELKLIMRLIKPEYFIPIHGEYRMLKKHAEIANSCSIDKDHTFVIKNGDRIALNKDKVYLKDSIPINSIYVDGKRIGNIGTSIIKDRKIMSTDGVLIAILNVNSENRTLTLNPNVTTRGFVIVNENQNLINDIEKKIKQIAISELNKETFNHIDLKNRIILEINSYIIELTGRRPIIMPMILETKI